MLIDPTHNFGWLLEGEPWVKYRTYIDLLHQPESDPQVAEARRTILAHPKVQNLITELAEWPGAVLNNHKNAGHPIHRLTFLADVGLTANDPGMGDIINRIMGRQSPEGPFQVLMNIPTHFGGTGKDQWAWLICDAPLVLYALMKFGLGKDPRVQDGIHHLVSLIRNNGWPCAASKELGRFRGPGRKEDPCPYANLVMLKVLSQFDDLRDSLVCQTGAEALLNLWFKSKERHPFLFYMGTDFRKLKAPLVWYDILHVLEVLSQFPWLRQDERLLAMLVTVKAKADPEGYYVPESIWTAWKDWDFGQKRAPSRWLTFLVWRSIERFRSSPYS